MKYSEYLKDHQWVLTIYLALIALVFTLFGWVPAVFMLSFLIAFICLQFFVWKIKKRDKSVALLMPFD